MSVGFFRGLVQVPLYLGSCTYLVINGLTVESAISETFLYIFSLPKIFSFALEFMGGVFSYKMGPRGSFLSITLGKFLRTLALFLMGVSFSISSVTFFLIFNCIAILIGEIGRSLLSGSFEDSYERSLKIIASKKVEDVEVMKMKTMRFFQFSISFIATFSVGIMAKNNDSQFLELIFYFVALINLFAVFAHYRWYKWSCLQFDKDEKVFPSVKNQFIFFIKSIDMTFIIGIGIINFIYIKTVTLGSLTSTHFLQNLKMNYLSWKDILVVSCCSILVPLGSIVGLKLCFHKSSGERLNKYLSKKGIFYTSIWATSAVILYSFHPLPIIMNFTTIILFAASFAPLYLWHNWLRIKITDSAISKGAPIGQNRSLYYSIIEGGKESIIGVTALLSSNFEIKYLLVAIFFLLAWSVLQSSTESSSLRG